MSSANTYTRYYNADDIVSMTIGLPLSKMSHSGCLKVLKGVDAKLGIFSHLLHHYPASQYEPLEFLYASRRALDAYNTQLLTDLVMDDLHTFQTFGLWLNCLKSTPCDETVLRATTPMSHGGRELLTIALARHGDDLPEALKQLADKVTTIRSLVNSMLDQPHPLRLSPAGAVLDVYLAERALLQDAYRTGGLAKAKPLLKQPLLHYYLLTPEQWRLAGAPSIPAFKS